MTENEVLVLLGERADAAACALVAQAPRYDAHDRAVLGVLLHRSHPITADLITAACPNNSSPRRKEVA